MQYVPRISLVALVALGLGASVGCGDDDPEQQTPPLTRVTISENATASTTWAKTNLYVADAGSAATLCVFTSLKDDSFGGDSNDDGSVFNSCQFYYGGASMPT